MCLGMLRPTKPVAGRQMRASSQFTMAVHLLACVSVFSDRRVTSDLIASSIGTNPVVVRRLLQRLKASDIVEVTRGAGGITLALPAERITLLDVFNAVGEPEGTEGALFRFHENPNPACPVGRGIHRALDPQLERARKAFERELASATLADVLSGIPPAADGEALWGTCR